MAFACIGLDGFTNRHLPRAAKFRGWHLTVELAKWTPGQFVGPTWGSILHDCGGASV